MSDKESDSGTSTSHGKKTTNGSGSTLTGNNGSAMATSSNLDDSTKEPRKRGRRPKNSKEIPM